MTRSQKIALLNQKAKCGQKIRIAFVRLDICGAAAKDKTLALQKFLRDDSRFEVVNIHNIQHFNAAYKSFDLVVPQEQYEKFTFNGNSSAKADFIDNKKILNVRYSLGWHKTVQDNVYSWAFLNFVDEPDICQRPYDACTGHPWTEILSKPASEFLNPWKTDKKHILICPHHSVHVGSRSNSNIYRNRSDFFQRCDDIIKVIEKHKDDVEFVMRPHPNLFKYIDYCSDVLNHKKVSLKDFDKKAMASHCLNSIRSRIDVICDDDYISWFKHSDAMIHDCGSFRCEYLYTGKPACYLANKTNMDAAIWSQMGRDAIDCHELCWPGESIESFVQRVIDGKDAKAEDRRQYFEKHIDKLVNGKTPCQNIVDALFGIGAYSHLREVK